MSDEEGTQIPASEAEASAAEPAGGAAPITEPAPPVADASAPPSPPPAAPAAAPSGWGRPSGLPVLTLALGALLIGVLAFGIGVFAGRSSAEGTDGRFGFARGGGDRGGMMPGQGQMPGRGTAMPWMPGGTLPGNGSGTFPGMPGVGVGGGAGEIGAVPGNWAMTAGTVTSVDGGTIVVQSIKGNTVTVHTSDATSIRIVRDQGEDGDAVAKGDDIVVAGTPGDVDLTIDAVRIIAGDLPWIRSIGSGASSDGSASSGGSATTSS